MNQEKIENLIEQSKLHNKIAFRQLVEICQPFVYRIAFRLLCNKEEAEDIVQESFIKVWLNLHKYNYQNRFSTWLYKITCNLCYDKLRSMKLSPSTPLVSVDLSELMIPDECDIEKTIINKELIKLITAITYNLPPKQRIVFTLKDIEGLEVNEISEITGLSKAKIKSNLYLAREYIRKRVKN